MATIINNNHFCLGLVDFETGCFSFIDPVGSCREKTQHYLNKFVKFLNAHNLFYNTAYDCSSLKVRCYEHIRQNDSYNCGPLILYFFENISKNESAKEFKDMKQYRRYLQNLIIHKAPDMSQQCLLCSRKFVPADAVQCDFCKRYVHLKCNTIAAKSFINYKMCDICRIY